MKIERIDDKTVKCFLSNEELEEYDIDYKDFVTRSDKAKEVVQEIIEQAEEEVGYKPPKYAFDLQIMMLPEEGLVLVLSDKDPAESKPNTPMQALRELMRICKEVEKKVQQEEATEKSGAPAQSESSEKNKKKQKLREKNETSAFFLQRKKIIKQKSGDKSQKNMVSDKEKDQ